ERAPSAVGVEILVRDARVNVAARNIAPVVLARVERAHARGLKGREYTVAQALFDEHVERRVVARGLGEPERFGLAPEAEPEVGQAPANLRAAVALVAQGEYRVVVALRYRVAVAAAPSHALAVGLDDAR